MPESPLALATISSSTSPRSGEQYLEDTDKLFSDDEDDEDDEDDW